MEYDNHELEELKREFNRPGSTMRVHEYGARRAEIKARAPADVLAQEAAREAHADRSFITLGTLKNVLQGLNKLIFNAIGARNADIEMLRNRTERLKETIDSARFEVKAARTENENAISPIATRLANIEFKVAALALRLGEQSPEAEMIDKLRARVAALEARPTVEYRGVWSADDEYRPGDMVTHSGSIWHCYAGPSRGQRPGDSSDWQLAVKRGRDGKDAR